MSGIRLSLAVVLLASPSVAMAQRIVAPGDTVQVRLTGGGRALQGVALSATDHSLVVQQVNGADKQVAVQVTRSIHVLDGRVSGAGKGAKAGLVIGIVGGGMLGIAACCGSEGMIDLGPEFAIATAAAGGLTGAFLGVFIGAFATADRWVQARLPAIPGDAPKGLTTVRYAPTIRMGVESTVLLGLRLRR